MSLTLHVIKHGFLKYVLVSSKSLCAEYKLESTSFKYHINKYHNIEFLLFLSVFIMQIKDSVKNYVVISE